MLTRRHFAALLAGAALLPAAASAQRRTADPGIAMPAAGERAWKAEVPVLRIGLLGGENETDRARPLRRLPGADRGDLQGAGAALPGLRLCRRVQAFSAKQIEMAGLGASGYAGAWLDTHGGIEPLVVPEEKDGSVSYISVMVVRADSGITSLEQMRGKRRLGRPQLHLGLPHPALRAAPGRHRAGARPVLLRTGFAGGHEQGVVALLQKQYDAAVTWASGQGDEAAGFTRGNLHAMVEKGMLDMRDLRIIWRSAPIPNGPTAVRTDLPAAFKEDMKLFHLALPKAHPQVYQEIERGGGTGYRESRHEDFQMIVDLRKAEANERRRRS